MSISFNMRAVTFSKTEDGWEARPFQGWQYRIIKRWLKGYVLYFNGQTIASEARLNDLKTAAKEHLAGCYPTEG